MKRGEFLTTSRAVIIFEQMISCRRAFCADNDFFRMTDFWEDLCDEDGRWTIKTYRSSETDDSKRKAGVIAFGDRVTLSVDKKLTENAKQGCKLSNFILAHEIGHVALGHHARSAFTKNFQLMAGTRGMSISPPSLEEMEADFAGVFLQCGIALSDPNWASVALANRAFTDISYVKKLQRIVQLDVFQRHLNRPRPTFPRVIL